MSAVAGGEGADPIQVLFTLHQNMNALDFTGPLEIFARALHDLKNEGKSLTLIVCIQWRIISQFDSNLVSARLLLICALQYRIEGL